MKKLFTRLLSIGIAATMMTTGLAINSAAASVKSDTSKSSVSAETKEDKRFKKITDEIVAKANKYTDTYDRLKVIHDELCEIAKYDISYKRKNWKKILLEGRGVCDAYAKAYEYLCQKAGLDVIYVTGLANGVNGWEPHAWDMAKIDGKWYYIDVCWDDSKFGGYHHSNFLVGEKTINVSHFIHPDNHPEASKSDYLNEKISIGLTGNIATWGEVGKIYYIFIPEGYEDYNLKWSLSNDNAEIVSYSLENHVGYREDHTGKTYEVIVKGIEIKLKKPGKVSITCTISSENVTVQTEPVVIRIEEPFDPGLGYKNTSAADTSRTLFNIANPKFYLGLNVTLDLNLFADIKPGTLADTSNQDRIKVTKTKTGYTMTARSGLGYVTIRNGTETSKLCVVACKKYAKPSYLDLKLSQTVINVGDTFAVNALSDRNESDELVWLFSNDNIKLAEELSEKGNSSVKFTAVSKGTTIIRCITSSGFEASYTATIK